MRTFFRENWLLITLASFVLFCIVHSCTQEPRKEPFTGYVVAKEYTPRHMCHTEVTTVVEAGYTPVHIPVHTHTHHMQEPEFILHVANKDELKHIPVDSITYFRTELLEKYTYY